MSILPSLSPPLPCSGSYLAFYTVFKSRLLKDLLGENIQWNSFVQGNTVPWEYLLLFPSKNKISDLSFNLKAATSLDIQLSRRRERDKFLLLFWIRKCLPMLLHSQVPTISIRSIFSPPSLYRGRKKLQSSYLKLF